MTLRQLFAMAWGKAKEQRRLVVAQASLVWSSANLEQIEEFIRSGHLDCEAATTSTGGDDERIPYDASLLRGMVNRGQA